MKKLLIIGIIALLPLTGMADTVFGFKFGAGSWTHDPSGNVAVTSSGGAGTSADLKEGLRLAEDSEGYTYFALEHPIPLVPNIKVMQTGLTTSGTGTSTVSYTFNGDTVTAGVTGVTTTLQLDQTDYILYYEILDNDFVSFDLGLNAKHVDGKATVNSNTVSFSGYVPMLYAAAEIGLPADLTLGVEASMLEVDDSEISDLTVKMTYTTDFMLGIEAGVRTQTIKLSGFDGVNSNIEFDGIFAGVFFKF